MAELELPVSFRAEIASQILRTALAGESCSLIGIGSVGKSNVARHLCRSDVLAHHLDVLRATPHSVLCVFVDCLKLSGFTLLDLFRLMLRALHQTARGLAGQAVIPPMPHIASQIGDVVSRLPSGASEDDVSDALRAALKVVYAAPFERVLFVVDDFDSFAQNCPSSALLAFRSLRNDFKPKLTYALFLRRELHQLRPNRAEYHEFYELASATTLPIGPNNLQDALFIVDRLEARWNPAHRLNDRERQNVLELSGRHPGLLKAILWAQTNDSSIDLNTPEVVGVLAAHKDVRPECGNILSSLDRHETDQLRAIADAGKPSGRVLRQLERKVLVERGLDGAQRVFSPVLRTFLLAQMSAAQPLPKPQAVSRLDAATHTVFVAGRAVNLTLLEFKLLEALRRKVNWRVSRQELLDAMTQVLDLGKLNGAADLQLSRQMRCLMDKVNTPQYVYISHFQDGSYGLKEA